MILAEKGADASLERITNLMTVHIFVSLVTLGLFCWNLFSLSKNIHSQKPVSWLLLAAMLPLMILMTYGPFVPLSHFIFEAFSGNILWYGILYALIWLLTGFFLWRYKSMGGNKVFFIFFSALWAIMAFWYYLGISLSKFEPGAATPGVLDAPIYIAHWMSVHLATLFALSLLYFSPEYRKSRMRTIIFWILFAVYILFTLTQKIL